MHVWMELKDAKCTWMACKMLNAFVYMDAPNDVKMHRQVWRIVRCICICGCL